MEPDTQDKDNVKPSIEDETQDLESSNKKLPYPKSVIFICANEFCERFSFYGMRAILSIYLKNILGYTENTATMVYHLFIVFAYLTPMMGAMLADSVLGKFRTIFYLSIVYCAGQILLSITAIPDLKFPAESMSMLGLALIALGTGGIKPCVSSFGADQFKMPEQEAQIGTYFSVFYFCINAGSLISTFITPIFREDVGCFGDETCYSLAFGVPAALMIVSLVIFVIGRPWYRIAQPSGNLFLRVLKTVFHALGRKRKLKENRAHWMDYADDICSQREIDDIKILLQVLWLYLPLPVYWALYDQQGSRWTFQATRMDGSLGGFTIKPDQMQLANAFLILLFIPMFDKIVYPILAKCRLLKKPLQRLTAGGVLIGVAFVVSGLVEIQLQKTYPVEILKGESYLQVINMGNSGGNKSFSGSLQRFGSNDMPPNFNLGEGKQYLTDPPVPAGNYSLTFKEFPFNETLELASEKATTILLFERNGTFELVYPKDKQEHVKPEDDEDPLSAAAQTEKSEDALPYFRIIQYGIWFDCNGEANCTNEERFFFLNRTDDCKEKCLFEFKSESNSSIYSDFRSTPAMEVEAGTYKLYYGYTNVSVGNEFELDTGGSYVYTVILREGETEPQGQLNLLTEPNSMHMLWLLPQYVILTAAEVMFSVTIMDFSYSEAPTSMKSVLQACWLLTVAGGNVIIAIVAELEIFNRQWKEFFLFAGLMFADMILFAYMAYIYKPAQLGDKEESTALESMSDGQTNDGYSSDKEDKKED